MKKIVSLLCIALLLCLCSVTAFSQESAEISGVMILRQPQEGFFPEYSVAFYQVEVYGKNLTYNWFLIFEEETYDLSQPTGDQPWEAFAGEEYGTNPAGNAYHFGGILKGLDGAKIYCTVSDGINSVDTEQIRVNVLGEGAAMPPTFMVPASLEVKQGAIADLYCNATDPKGGTVSYEWSLCQKGDPYTRETIDHESAATDTLHCSTDEVGTYYVVCKITTSSGGTALTHAIPVIVLGEEVTTEPNSDGSEQSDVSVSVTDTQESGLSTETFLENSISDGTDAETTDFAEEETPSSEKKDSLPAPTDSQVQTDFFTETFSSEETDLSVQQKPAEEGFPLLWVAVPVAVVLAGGGAAGFLFLRKRK